MNESSRIAYLDAMGIDTYIARMRLPGAAYSPARVVGLQSAGPASPSPSAPVAVLRRLEEPLRAAGPGSESAIRAAPSGCAAVQSRAPVALAPFSLAAVRAGELLWLEELQDGAIASEQVQLIQAMARALGGGGEKPDVSQFDWPIHNNRQLDLGEEAARAALAGFLGRKLEQEACRGVVFLGEECRLRVSLEQFGSVTVVTTVSTACMLREPPCKKQAWRDLQPLRTRL